MARGPQVIIAGAGPVGLALAFGLARAQVCSLVLEAKPQLSRHSKAPGIHARTLEIFHAWDILEDFLAAGTLLQRVDLRQVDHAEPVATIDLTPLGAETRTPGVLVLPQDRTEALLAEALATTGYGGIRCGHAVSGFQQDATGVTVQVTPPAGRPYTVRAPYLVGCDGAHSTVRRCLGWELEGKTYRTQAALADITLPDERNALPWPRLATSGRQIRVALRLAPGLWRIIQLVPPGQAAEATVSTEGLQAAVGRLFGPGPFERVWASTFHLHGRTSPHFRQGRVLLAGDAAHLNSPVGGQGMNSGIHDAHNLAWKLERALSGGDAEALLCSYEQERRPVVLENVDRTTDLLTRLVTLPVTPLRDLLAKGARRLLGDPRLVLPLLRRMTMLDGHYGPSRLIAGSDGLLGRHAPDATLAAHDGRRERLHDLLFPDAVLLLCDDGRLPGWDHDAIAGLLAAVPQVNVVRLQPRTLTMAPGDWQDVNGVLWQRWRLTGGMAVLVRPDGHVGWVGRHPTAAALRNGVGRALGAASMPTVSQKPSAA